MQQQPVSARVNDSEFWDDRKQMRTLTDLYQHYECFRNVYFSQCRNTSWKKSAKLRLANISSLNSGVLVQGHLSLSANGALAPWPILEGAFSKFNIVIFLSFVGNINTLCLKKVPTFKFFVTLSNLNRFSKLLHCWKAYEICCKPMQHYSSHLRHVATLPC